MSSKNLNQVIGGGPPQVANAFSSRTAMKRLANGGGTFCAHGNPLGLLKEVVMKPESVLGNDHLQKISEHVLE